MSEVEAAQDEGVAAAAAVAAAVAAAEVAAAAAAAAAAEKARSRLSRCGACNNCNRRDCGLCVNCVDKPKFGGPGIKKQACIARKCLNMQAREESAEGGGDDAAQARKRPKPAQPPTAAPGSAAAGDGERAQADAVGAAKAPRSHSDENNSESNAAGMDTDEIAPGVAAARKEHKDATWAGNTDVLLDYLVRRKGRTEGWKRLRETDLEEGRALDVGGDWPWADKTALEEEFISMNDRHRRESNTAPNLNALLVH
ncbi:hypothetical protein KFE25_007577 [Diacronema lutheri]|uniref:CXXC-type domain-containing protein n=1 Tax=Diacronema lutheri TaxID=2081491 RepID=A0A8J6CDX3_DIALT|nr:hypothetical protein KFE25_007577 [Diacronema lutheri]